MAQKWNDAPEVATHTNLPEVYFPAPALAAPYHAHGESLGSIPLNPFSQSKHMTTLIESPKSFYPSPNSIQNYDLPSTEQHQRQTSRRICRCSFIVLVLSVLVTALSITVIGLAAGTGVETNRANNAESKLASQPIIDHGCSKNPDSVTGTQYTSDFYDRSTFKIFCNSDAPNPPLQSFFVGTFDDCIDACASYSAYTSGNFPDVSSSSNFTCSGVSFIPDWTNRTTALSVNAPGNCYLKPGPQKSTGLTHPSAEGPAVHAAIISSS
ncbi:hypothetical protein F5B22DRAFT_588072 [Xylaria bambusicola]|uniref:uncharacterized protein n=1 Tax=Xylaria bambusicola TaxID=326684 RepID=UPI0020076158|nr:uncharacterized protein F5B22DRAFT_588072 [Xylaria bambusicola]KAI0525861.1 hypothetical protein F5B22DRAFT_588072 [Xylaria bambusicola]